MLLMKMSDVLLRTALCQGTGAHLHFLFTGFPLTCFFVVTVFSKRHIKEREPQKIINKFFGIESLYPLYSRE